MRNEMAALQKYSHHSPNPRCSRTLAVPFLSVVLTEWLRSVFLKSIVPLLVQIGSWLTQSDQWTCLMFLRSLWQPCVGSMSWWKVTRNPSLFKTKATLQHIASTSMLSPWKLQTCAVAVVSWTIVRQPVTPPPGQSVTESLLTLCFQPNSEYLEPQQRGLYHWKPFQACRAESSC